MGHLCCTIPAFFLDLGVSAEAEAESSPALPEVVEEVVVVDAAAVAVVVPSTGAFLIRTLR